MTVSDGRDDVLGAERRIAAKKHLRIGRLKGGSVNDRLTPFIKFNAGALLYPRERYFLPNGDQHIVGLDENRLLTGGYQPALTVFVHRLYAIECHTDQASVVTDKAQRRVVRQKRNTLALRILFFPR